MCPGIGRNIIVIQRAQVRVINVAATSHVKVPIDHTKTGPSQRGRHTCTRCIPSVSHRVILPHLTERRIDTATVISTHQVDLAGEIARSHEGAYVRHRRPRAPRVCGNVIDARGIHHRGKGILFTTKDEELVDIRRIHGRSLAIIQIGHRSKRRPRIGNRIELAELVDIISDREGVTATLIGKGAIAVHESAVVINPHWSGLRPRPRTASR